LSEAEVAVEPTGEVAEGTRNAGSEVLYFRKVVFL